MTTREEALSEMQNIGMVMNPQTVSALPDAVLEMVLKASRKLASLDLIDLHADLSERQAVHVEMCESRGLTQCPLCNAVLVLEA